MDSINQLVYLMTEAVANMFLVIVIIGIFLTIDLVIKIINIYKKKEIIVIVKIEDEENRNGKQT